MKSSVLVKKKAVTTKSAEDGALSEIKVKIELYNKSRKMLKNVSVVDLVPVIANVEKSLELGTLRPHKIKHGKEGTLRSVWKSIDYRNSSKG